MNLKKYTNKKTSRCYACGSKLERDERLVEYEYKGERTSILQPGWYCTSCDEAVFVGPDLTEAEPKLAEFRAHVDGILTSNEVKEIRERLNLSQRKAGEILGGGPRAFQKYESGQQALSKPMSNLLLLLGQKPERLHELKKLQELRSKVRRGNPGK
jgi:HTH-type transcriptional regulator / antitoxin MqsA